MNSDLLQGFYLGDWLVNPDSGQLTGQTGSVHLPPKAMRVLLVLASHPGTLVTIGELLEEVWADGDGSNENLRLAMREIEQALDDHADNPTFIQTLPDRGYRLLAPVTPASIHAESVVIGVQGETPVASLGFLENLKRRGVFETAIAYLILGWLIIQIADIVFAQLLLPPWIGTFVTVLVIAGFPIAVALSWFLEFRDGNAVLHELSPRDAIRRRFSRTYLSVVGAMAIAAIIVFIYDQNIGLPEATQITNDDPSLPPVLDNSIAVLPFLNVDGSDVTQIFADGLTDDLITRLSRVPGLLVSARGDAYTLDPNTASRKVRERLRVAHYLEGSVQIANDKLRIIVQMIDSATGFHIMSRRFDEPREDFFEIRNQITDLTVANVRVSLPPDTQAEYQSFVDDTVLDAYVLYRRGIEATDQPTNIENVEAALSWFDAALEIDSEFAAAHAGKCRAYVDAYPETDIVEYIALAQASCYQALELNPRLDIVHTALGDLFQVTGRYGDAEKAYQEALDLDPKSVDALIGIGHTYQLLSEPENAEKSFRRAIGLRPGDWSGYYALGAYLYDNGRYAEAVDEYRHVVALDQSNYLGYSNLGVAYLLMGEFEKGEEALESAITIQPHANAYSSLGLTLYYLGRLDEAISAHRTAVELNPNDRLNWSNLGDALWIAGNEVEARDAFTRADGLARRALAVNANAPGILMDLAWISAMLDRTDEALTLINRAISLRPDDPYAHYYHGLVLLRSGQEQDAIAALAQAARQGYSIEMMAAEPHLESLLQHIEFKNILRSRR